MGSRRFLFTFGLAGGLCTGLLAALLVHAVLLRAPGGEGLPAAGWGAAVLACTAGFLLFGWATWYRWAAARTRNHRRALSRLAAGDLTAAAAETAAEPDVRRLQLSLRRALSQVQRVTGSLRRASRDVGEQAAAVLEAARRQGAAADRSLAAVADMGGSLQATGERVVGLEQFAREATGALGEMTSRIEQVAEALATLNASSHATSVQVSDMGSRLTAIADSADALGRFATEAGEFAGRVQGSIAAVRRRAEDAGALAREVTATADRGEAQVRDSARGMYRLEETVRRAAGLVEELGGKSAQIGRAVDVIQEVADQTHLLALNAAIIAAQAGEHGRAFAVVADGVRGLAERTARSTREIAAVVAGVRRGVERAVALVTDGREQAVQGVALADRAAEALQAIRTTTARTYAALESTVAEAAQLEAQGVAVAEAAGQVARRVDAVTQAAVGQAVHGRELAQRTQEMARLAEAASDKAGDQARVGRALSASVGRLAAATEDIRSAHRVLTRGDAAIQEEVAQVREDAQRVVRAGDDLSRAVERLSREAGTLEAEVFRFRLPEPRAGGTLRAGLHQAVALETTRGLDPLFTLDNQLVEVSAALYAPLLRSEDGVLLPELAERWEADPSARRYRFTLRPGLAFHDGVPLTAGHVKAHLERLLDPALAAPDAWLFHSVEGAQDFLQGRTPHVAGLTVLDPLTLEVRLSEPRAFFLHLVTLSAAGVARKEADGRLVGSGPFRPVRVEADGIVLERNPSWFRPGLPRVDRLEFVPYAGREQALARLAAGEVDLVSALTARALGAGGPGGEERGEEHEGLHAGLHGEAAGGVPQLRGGQVVAGSTPSCFFLAFSSREPPFDEPRVRRAVRAGLDVAAMVARFHPGARPARSLTPPELLLGGAADAAPPGGELAGAELPGAAPARPDVALAARLLQEAGQGRLRLRLPFATGRDTREEDAVLFRPLLEAGLLELSHEELRPADFWRLMAEKGAPVFRAGWIADYPDPDDFLYFLLHSSAQSVFKLGWASGELDALVARARVSIDPAQRRHLYLQAEALVARDCPLVPLFHDRSYAAASARVQGLRLHQVPPQLRFEQLWLDDGPGG
jgi:methyl-accepting chemotaxis protein/ABC-type oligopeptide transport system substrate-binding subunit